MLWLISLRTVGCADQTVMTFQDAPDNESHDRFPSPRTPLPQRGRGEIRESLPRLS